MVVTIIQMSFITIHFEKWPATTDHVCHLRGALSDRFYCLWKLFLLRKAARNLFLDLYFFLKRGAPSWSVGYLRRKFVIHLAFIWLIQWSLFNITILFLIYILMKNFLASLTSLAIPTIDLLWSQQDV